MRAIVRAVSSMDEETREVIVDAFRRLGGSLKGALPEWFEETAGQIRSMIAQRGAEKSIERLNEKMEEKSNRREEKN